MLQGVNVAGVHVDHGVREGESLVYGLGLLVVVAQNEVPDLVGHAGEQLVALLLGHVAGLDDGVEQDLDVHLVVRAVHPCRVVDSVHVDPAATERVLYAPPLREPEVPPSPTTRHLSSSPFALRVSFALSPTSALLSELALT